MTQNNYYYLWTDKIYVEKLLHSKKKKDYLQLKFALSRILCNSPCSIREQTFVRLRYTLCLNSTNTFEHVMPCYAFAALGSMLPDGNAMYLSVKPAARYIVTPSIGLPSV